MDLTVNPRFAEMLHGGYTALTAWQYGKGKSLHNTTYCRDAMMCDRCGGFIVKEWFYGADVTVAAWSCEGFRCLNCGGISFTARTLEHRRSDGTFLEEHQ